MHSLSYGYFLCSILGVHRLPTMVTCELGYYLGGVILIGEVYFGYLREKLYWYIIGIGSIPIAIMYYLGIWGDMEVLFTGAAVSFAATMWASYVRKKRKTEKKGLAPLLIHNDVLWGLFGAGVGAAFAPWHYYRGYGDSSLIATGIIISSIAMAIIAYRDLKKRRKVE